MFLNLASNVRVEWKRDGHNPKNVTLGPMITKTTRTTTTRKAQTQIRRSSIDFASRTTAYLSPERPSRSFLTPQPALILEIPCIYHCSWWSAPEVGTGIITILPIVWLLHRHDKSSFPTIIPGFQTCAGDSWNYLDEEERRRRKHMPFIGFHRTQALLFRNDAGGTVVPLPAEVVTNLKKHSRNLHIYNSTIQLKCGIVWFLSWGGNMMISQLN